MFSNIIAGYCLRHQLSISGHLTAIVAYRGKGENVSCAGWQVTLWWHLSLVSVKLVENCYTQFMSAIPAGSASQPAQWYITHSQSLAHCHHFGHLLYSISALNELSEAFWKQCKTVKQTYANKKTNTMVCYWPWVRDSTASTLAVTLGDVFSDVLIW